MVMSARAEVELDCAETQSFVLFGSASVPLTPTHAWFVSALGDVAVVTSVSCGAVALIASGPSRVQVNVGAASAFTPMGGYRQSGIGRERGVLGIREFQLAKHVVVGTM